MKLLHLAKIRAFAWKVCRKYWNILYFEAQTVEIHFTDILNESHDIFGYLKMRAKLNKRCPKERKMKDRRLKEKTGRPYDKMLID